MPGLIAHGMANPETSNLLHHNEEPPFPMRGDSMSLDSVRPKDVPRGPVRYPKEDSQALRTHDIERAQPTYAYKSLYTTGPPQKDPVPGAAARTHYPELKGRPLDLSLTTSDIPGAQPNVNRFRTNRVVDPLTPRYPLPSHRELPPEVPGVRMHEGRMRNTLDFKGEWKSRKPERNYSRDPNEHRDIEYSQPSARCRSQRPSTRDHDKTVERAGERILSSKHVATPRTTCPLDPVYDVHARSTHPYLQSESPSRLMPSQAGPVEGAASRVLHRDNGEPQTSLIRADIPGALPQKYKGGIPFSIYDPPEVTPYSGHLGLDCSDIAGAQTGTRRPGR